MIECPKCGGDGGMDAAVFGDHGWHPCYFCGTTGFVTPEAMVAYEAQEEEAMAGLYSGYRPEWDDDGVWNPEDDQVVTSSYQPLTDEDIPF
jgi:hypothetical protein